MGLRERAIPADMSVEAPGPRVALCRLGIGMSDWLGRPLTTPEQIVKAALERTLAAAGKIGDLAAALQPLAARAPDSFFAAAVSLLGSMVDVQARRRLYDAVAECPQFWLELLRPGRFDRFALLNVCRFLMTIEDVLDVRLARMLPGRYSNDWQINLETVLRVLDLLDQLSPGSRLILLLNHLTAHADCRIASKATLLVGRRLRNQDWVAQRLDSEDGRVRASAVEGLWGVASPPAQASLWASLKDKNNRVVGNALIGLHRLGEPRVNEFVKRMIEDPRPPFRWTAAWVMGKIGAEEFLEYLERATRDPEPHVQRAAGRALESILHGGESPSEMAALPIPQSHLAEPAAPQPRPEPHS